MCHHVLKSVRDTQWVITSTALQVPVVHGEDIQGTVRCSKEVTGRMSQRCPGRLQGLLSIWIRTWRKHWLQIIMYLCLETIGEVEKIKLAFYLTVSASGRWDQREKLFPSELLPYDQQQRYGELFAALGSHCPFRSLYIFICKHGSKNLDHLKKWCLPALVSVLFSTELQTELKMYFSSGIYLKRSLFKN